MRRMGGVHLLDQPANRDPAYQTRLAFFYRRHRQQYQLKYPQ